jgi:hypothetical protein
MKRERERERERKREQKAEVDLSFISAKRIGRVSRFLECGDRKGPGGQQYFTIQNAAILYCRPCAHVKIINTSQNTTVHNTVHSCVLIVLYDASYFAGANSTTISSCATMVFCTIAQKSIEISFLQLVSALNYYDHALLLDPRHMWYTPSLRAQVNAISFIAYCHHARFCAEVFSSFENLKKKKKKKSCIYLGNW